MGTVVRIYIIDPCLLIIDRVSNDLWIILDYASDFLAFNLVSYDTLCKL